MSRVMRIVTAVTLWKCLFARLFAPLTWQNLPFWLPSATRMLDIILRTFTTGVRSQLVTGTVIHCEADFVS